MVSLSVPWIGVGWARWVCDKPLVGLLVPARHMGTTCAICAICAWPMDPHVMVAVVMCGSASVVAGGVLHASCMVHGAHHTSLIGWMAAVSRWPGVITLPQQSAVHGKCCRQ